ncbi:MAG: hypothetical protein GC184_15405, partial [Rhizobiales bacterium]|nr:hypothetical protein [Hyphomicrobiales bacterium]
MLLRRRLFGVLEAGRDNLPARLFNIFMVVLILSNVAAVVLETEPALGEYIRRELRYFDIFSVGIFTIEYFLRLWVAVEHRPLAQLAAWKARLTWSVTPPMLIDLAAILPFYLAMIVSFDPRLALLLRLIRFLKLARATPALGTLGRVLYNERRAIFGTLIVMMGLIIFSATVMYELEGETQPHAFGSIPRAMWWSVTTLT